MKKQKKKLLLVEDDADDIYFFKKACHCQGVDVNLVVLNDGREFLDYIATHNCKSDLILLDLNMPTVGGLEVLSKLERAGLIKELNVVVYTTSDRNADVDKANQLGAKSYIQKPCSQERLNLLIKSIYLYWFEFNLFLRKSPS